MGDISVEAPSSAVWTVVRLQDVADLRGGYAFKSGDYRDEGVFILRTLNIGGDGSITRENAVFIDNAREQEFEQFKLEEWDTLFVMVGATLGKCGLVRGTDLPALLNQNMWRIRANHKVMEPRFLYYLFSFESQRLLSYASGAARDFVRRDDYRNLSLTVPPLSEQQKIAGVLGALDDKIECNRRVAKLTRQIMALRFSAASSNASWDTPLSDWAVLTKGVEPGRSACSEDPIGQPFIRVGDLGQERTSLWTRFETDVVATDADVLVSFDGTPGRVATGMTGVFSSGIRRVDSVRESISRSLLFALFDSAEVQQVIQTYATGTTILHAGGSIARIKVPSFDVALTRELSAQLDELGDRRRGAIRENSILKQIRDTLLPELLTGRLRVRDAEKVVEDSV